MLTEAGYHVISLCGHTDVDRLANYTNPLDLLILGHDVPGEEKRRALTLFRQRNRAPVLSLLNAYQTKPPEADFGVGASIPGEFVEAVEKILNNEMEDQRLLM